MSSNSSKELRQLLIRLAATLDRIKDTDLTIEAQVLLSDCSQTCDELLERIYVAVAAESAREERESSQAPQSPTLAPATAEKLKTVMVIDDDEDTLRLLNYLLSKKAGFRVICQSNPVAALEGLHKKTPDVILMDLMMPQMTGFELLRKIREDKDFAGVKVLVGSSRSFDKDRLAILQAGANDFVAKPYNIEELILRLRNLIS